MQSIECITDSAFNSLDLPSPSYAQAIRFIWRGLLRMPQIKAAVLTGSCARGQAHIGSDIDIKVVAMDQNVARLRQVTSVLAQRARTSLARGCGVPVEIDIEVSDGVINGAPDAPDGVFLDYEIDVAHLYVYGRALFTNGMLYSALRSTFLPYYASDLRKLRIASALERADRKLRLIRSQPGAAQSATAHVDLKHAGRFLFVAGFSFHHRYPVSFEKRLDWQCKTILDVPDIPTGLKRAFVASSDPNQDFGHRLEMYESLLSEFHDVLQ